MSPQASSPLPRVLGGLVPPLLAATAATLSGAPLAAQDLALESHPSRWRVTVEEIDEPGFQEFGLVGVHFDVLDPIPEFPDLYAGLGGYGVVSGENGGLFVGGLTVGYLRQLYPGWSVDLGLFSGGGGGGDLPVGSGLMVRPHLALEYALGGLALRGEVSHVNFPDGSIDDTTFALGVSLPTEILVAGEGRRPRRIESGDVIWRRLRVTPSALRLDPDGRAFRKDGLRLSDIEMIGIEVDYFLNDRLFIPAAAYGAGSGNVSGFAMALGGIGASIPLAGEALALEARAMAGSGGGGEVDTGGGFLWQLMGGISAALANGAEAKVEVGFTDAPEGQLEAITLLAGIGWSPRTAELSRQYSRARLREEGISGDVARLEGLDIELVNKTYFPRDRALTKNGAPMDDEIHLMGLGFGKGFVLLGQTFAITGRAYAAWDGDVGGYAEGLGGLRYEIEPVPSQPEHRIVAHLEAGVGGGGGVDTQTGLLYQLTAGYHYTFHPNARFTLEGGRVEADRGTFEAEVFQVGVTWTLDRAVLRR